MKSGVKTDLSQCAAKGRKVLAAQDDRSNVVRRDGAQAVVRLLVRLDDQGGGIN